MTTGYPDFTVRHRIWAYYRERWEMARDFWRGGLAVLQPNRPISTIEWAQESTDTEGGTRADDALISSRYEWISGVANSYLWKHARESRSDYEERCRRQINLPYFQYICNTLAAGVLKQRPTRTGVSPKWEPIHEDMDLLGTDVDAWFRRALTLGLVFGRVHCLTDRPRMSTPPKTRKEQLDRGGRVWAQLITPLELVDWSMDEFGHFKWAEILEAKPDEREPGRNDALKDVQLARYRVWFPDFWELWEEEYGQPSQPRTFKLIDQGFNPLGRVPLRTLFCTRVAETADMACESPISDALDFNRHQLNKLSELDETERAQAFAQLVMPKGDGQPGGPVELGKFRCLEVPMQFGVPMYLSPDPAHPQGAWQRIQEEGHEMRQYSSVGRGRAEYSKEERSAASLVEESADKRNQMAWWAKALQEFDGQVHADLADWEDLGEPPKATYPTTFESKATLSEVQEVVQVSAVPVMADAREAQAAMVAPVVRRILQERGAEDEDVTAALEDIKKAGKKKPEPPAIAGGKPPPFGAKPGDVTTRKLKGATQPPKQKGADANP